MFTGPIHEIMHWWQCFHLPIKYSKQWLLISIRAFQQTLLNFLHSNSAYWRRRLSKNLFPKQNVVLKKNIKLNIVVGSFIERTVRRKVLARFCGLDNLHLVSSRIKTAYKENGHSCNCYALWLNLFGPSQHYSVRTVWTLFRSV